MQKLLVAYFSLTGNTKFVAEKVANQINADLCEVVDKKYKKGRLLYLKGGGASMREKLTEIDVSKSIEEYDFIVIGSPVWAGKISPAIRTFLALNDFSNKKGAFFVTLAGDKTEKTLENMRKTTGFNSIVEELVISKALENKGETEEKIVNWCNLIKKTV